jgi:DNA-binding PadR family transcriptional regulator
MPVVVVEQEKEATKQGHREVTTEKEKKQKKEGDTAETQRSERSAARLKRTVRAKKKDGLTTPDLVLLSLLAERPMHGYQANAELERREIRDWAGISRPQVYYSLEKLAKSGMIRSLETDEPAAGPERSSFETTAKGRAALADALESENWTAQRDRPAFLTWVALSWQARPGVFREQLRRRQKFLVKELAREKETLRSVLEEVGHPYHEAVWMVSLMIEQFQTELRWLKRVARERKKRGQAKHPEYAAAGDGTKRKNIHREGAESTEKKKLTD